MNPHFNILDHPWIPVVLLDGTPQIVSARDALVHAQQYRGISAYLPHTNAAVLRLLLAILHRTYGPTDYAKWAELWHQGSFDTLELGRYFGKWHSRFDLFSSDHPFYQNRHPLVEEKPAQTLLQIIGGGDTFTLFDHVMDESPFKLGPSEAALLLVTAQSFGLAGLCHPQHKLVFTDAPCSRAITFFVEGKNLFETLMFNLVGYNRSEPMPWSDEGPDAPAWEMDDPYSPDRNIPFGYLDYLTWQNRRIMLIPNEENGQTVVSRVTLAPGLTIAPEVHNPMHHYSQVDGKKPEESSVRVMRFSEGRALWRDSHALLDLNNRAVDPPRAVRWMHELVNEGILPRRFLQMTAYGMCTEPGKQKVNFYRGESFEIDDELPRNPDLVGTLGMALTHAKGLRDELWGIFARLAAQVITFENDHKDGHKPDPKDVQNLVHHWNVEGLYWAHLETPFFHFISQLPANPDGALDQWHNDLRGAAHFTYNQTINGLGESQNALKAAALTRGLLNFAINKVLGTQKQEE